VSLFIFFEIMHALSSSKKRLEQNKVLMPNGMSLYLTDINFAQRICIKQEKTSYINIGVHAKIF
jgi:hypothetical protein